MQMYYRCCVFIFRFIKLNYVGILLKHNCEKIYTYVCRFGVKTQIICPEQNHKVELLCTPIVHRLFNYAQALYHTDYVKSYNRMILRIIVSQSMTIPKNNYDKEYPIAKRCYAIKRYLTFAIAIFRNSAFVLHSFLISVRRTLFTVSVNLHSVSIGLAE